MLEECRGGVSCVCGLQGWRLVLDESMDCDWDAERVWAGPTRNRMEVKKGAVGGSLSGCGLQGW
jgi:hypothetical protein